MKPKPAKMVTVDVMWNYEYQAKYYSGDEMLVLASNSLRNLKKAVKEEGWPQALITCRIDSLSYGQSVVDEYPYKPRYK